MTRLRSMISQSLMSLARHIVTLSHQIDGCRITMVRH